MHKLAALTLSNLEAAGWGRLACHLPFSGSSELDNN